MNVIAKEREKKNHRLKCYKCGSEEIQSFSNPVVEYASEKQTYNMVNICSKCNFTWLEKYDIIKNEDIK